MEQEIRKRLAEYYSPDEIESWLELPHPQLDGMAPIDFIRADRAELVTQIIDRLDADAYL